MTNPALAVLTSGGDAPGMNTAVATVVKVAAARGWRALGVEDGYDGLIDGRLVDLGPEQVQGVWQAGGTFLGSARSERMRTPAGRAQAAASLRAAGAEVLVVIGGNGSLTGAMVLAQETGIRVVGIPASIDNDLACTTTAIGVDTALNTIVQACDRISDTARSHRRVFIVEVMGRDCGYLAMASAIGAAADAALFREQGKGEDELVADLRQVVRTAFGRGKKRVLIIKAEGIEISTERLSARMRQTLAEDAPGATLRYTVLGHVVRGGSPSFRDRLVAGRLAHAATHLAIAGESGLMVGWEPNEEGGVATLDPAVQAFALPLVIERTASLLDGSHPTTKARVRLLKAVQGVLPL